MFANLTKKNVDRGKWRFLAEKEVRLLKFMNASYAKKKDDGKYPAKERETDNGGPVKEIVTKKIVTGTKTRTKKIVPAKKK